jgi:hypothetical protein
MNSALAGFLIFNFVRGAIGFKFIYIINKIKRKKILRVKNKLIINEL